ncbi:hypothetical protein Sps_05038 [Shewanella psychrophila]|uniref:Uncharacterized protein n=1 Tax=Shewanella psychrophila TaxID=225848 RepID=A0A1S6HX14_9GAMM|nr:hypothetical protein Sps_05038 [Shewanella psychrophila]
MLRTKPHGWKMCVEPSNKLATDSQLTKIEQRANKRVQMREEAIRSAEKEPANQAASILVKPSTLDWYKVFCGHMHSCFLQ